MSLFGNLLGVAGDAAGIIGSGGMDIGAWADAVDKVAGMAEGGSSSSGMDGQMAQMGTSLIGQLVMPMLNDSFST
jgi:hypothetical protein